MEITLKNFKLRNYPLVAFYNLLVFLAIFNLRVVNCVSLVEKRNSEIASRSKIANETEADPNEFPFQVLFLNVTNNKVLCSGSILEENLILTSAHCLHGYGVDDHKSWTIIAGDHNREVNKRVEQRRQIQDFHIHKGYIPISEINDLAIVKLDRPLQLTKQVQPILLPEADYEARGDAVVAGWGKDGFSVNESVLLKATVQIVDREDCRKAYEKRVGSHVSVKLSNGSLMILGVASNIIGCGTGEYPGPGIYMQVSKYVHWIQDTLISFNNLTNNCPADQQDCQNGGTCVDEINSFNCVCAEGFAGNKCEKVNKCHYPGTCTSPSDAGNCGKCQDGFVKDPQDGTKCKYANEKVSLIISSDKDIRIVSLDGRNTSRLTRDSARSIGYNFQTIKLFWFSHTDEKIYTGPINGENYVQKSIALKNSSEIIAFAVDWIHGHFYWLDSEKKFLALSNLNGSMTKVLFRDKHFSWNSIAVNPLNGWIYWTDILSSQIKRAGLDGSQRKVILNSKDKNLYGLVLDFVDSRLYWSQGISQSSIWSSDLDGLDLKLIFSPTSAQFSATNEQTPPSDNLVLRCNIFFRKEHRKKLEIA